MKTMFFLSVVLLMVAFSACTRKSETTALPEYATYQFQDSKGKSLEFKSFEGTPTFVSFIFTRCPMADMCPLTMRKTVQVYEKAKAANSSLKFVVVTIDPEFDTPEVMEEYAKRYNLDPEKFTLLTGADETISRMASQMANVIAMPSASYITHNVKSVLLNSRLEVVEEYKDNEWDADDVMKKLKTLPS